MVFSHRMRKVDYRIWTYFLAIPSFVFFTLSLTGCVYTSAGVPEIFAAKLEYHNNKSSAISEIRQGYFGVCAIVTERLICQPSTGKTSQTLMQSLTETSENDVYDPSTSIRLLEIGITLQSKIVLCLIVAASIFYALGTFCLLVLKRSFTAEVEEGRKAVNLREKLRSACLKLLWLSAALTLASALSVNQVTSALEYITRTESASEIQITGGKTLNILQWLAFASTSLFVTGVSCIFTREGGILSANGSKEANTYGNYPPSLDMPPPPPNQGMPPLPPPPPPPPPGY